MRQAKSVGRMGKSGRKSGGETRGKNRGRAGEEWVGRGWGRIGEELGKSG